MVKAGHITEATLKTIRESKRMTPEEYAYISNSGPLLTLIPAKQYLYGVRRTKILEAIPNFLIEGVNAIFTLSAAAMAVFWIAYLVTGIVGAVS